MKKCPFCAEEIQDEAVKCRHCGEFLDKKTKLPWYFQTYVLVLLILSIGPLALPLVWLHPKYGIVKKIVISVAVLVMTYYVCKMLSASVKSIEDYYKLIFDGTQPSI